MYVWKILDNFVPNISTEHNRIRSKMSLRHGRLCVVPPASKAISARIQTLREGSLCVNGPKLFNILPANVRNLTGVGVETFKKKLDDFLATIPDEPQSPGYTSFRRADTNSLLHMVPAFKQSCWADYIPSLTMKRCTPVQRWQSMPKAFYKYKYKYKYPPK